VFSKIEVNYTRWIRNQPKGILPGMIKGCLHVISWGYHFVATVRNWMFDHGWLRQYSPPVPVVISVGNIVAGGTGKTPAAQMIVQQFYGSHKLAILSRGYRSPAEKKGKPTLLCKGNGPLYPALQCGDEPYLLAERFPKAYVYVGKDRLQASNMAARDGADLILLDDGMQHRFLARDFDVVILDAEDPFGQGYFLPRGFLRENLKSLSRADLIIVNHAGNADRFGSIVKQIEQYSFAPVIGTAMEVEGIIDFEGQPVAALANKKVAAICGIANPDHFFATVEKLNAEVVLKNCISDHFSFTKDQLEKLCKKAREKGAEMIVCTEKDRVKIPDNLTLSLPLVWLKMHLKLVEGEAAWCEFIDKVRKKLK
jgi:tetraacyldisaccharide 4'-kinase